MRTPASEPLFCAASWPDSPHRGPPHRHNGGLGQETNPHRGDPGGRQLGGQPASFPSQPSQEPEGHLLRLCPIFLHIPRGQPPQGLPPAQFTGPLGQVGPGRWHALPTASAGSSPSPTRSLQDCTVPQTPATGPVGSLARAGGGRRSFRDTHTHRPASEDRGNAPRLTHTRSWGCLPLKALTAEGTAGQCDMQWTGLHGSSSALQVENQGDLFETPFSLLLNGRDTPCPGN